MISFSDSVQNDTPKKGNNNTEELFSDFSTLTSTPTANVNNDRGRQTKFLFCSFTHTPSL